MRRIFIFIFLVSLLFIQAIYGQADVVAPAAGISDASKTLIVLGIMAVLFVTELLPLSVTAMGGAIMLGILKVIPESAVFSGLSNSTVVLFAGMFVVGEAMFNTGLAGEIGSLVVRMFGKSEKGLMLGIMILAAMLSSISSNTATTAALMPMVAGVCAVAKIPSSRQYMPLAFAAGLGGTITLVGTPPNIIANAALKASDFRPFGFFEFAKIGIPLTIVGVLYMMFIGSKLLPKSENKALPDETVTEKMPQRNIRKMVITGVVLLTVIMIMALNIEALPLHTVAVIGALILVVAGCVDEKAAYHGIDWQTIFIFAGMMPVAKALEISGAGKMIANMVITGMGGSPSPYILCIVLFILSAGLTQFMSNTAAAALLCPIALSIASGINANPHSVIMIVTIAASCAFATPIGTPPNTLVLGAGNYKFIDYVKVGTPLIFILMVVCVILIPMIWPFY